MATYRNSIATTGTAGTGDRTTGALAWATGDLVVVFSTVAANTNDTPTCSDTLGGTYALVALGNYQSAVPNDYRMACFVRTTLSTGAATPTITVATGSNTSGVVAQLLIAGMTRTGASAIRQVAQQNAQAAGGTANPVFAISALTSNLTICACANSSNPPAMTAPTGWTEREDAGTGTPSVGLEICTRNSGFTGTALTWDTSGTQFATMFLELDISGPGVTLTATAGAYAITGTAAALLLGRRLAATPGGYAVTGTPVALVRGRTLTAQAGSYTVTGTAVTLQRGRTLGATAGAYAVAGTPASLLLGRRLGASGGAYSVSGTAATLTYTPAGAAFVLTAQPGAYAISGTAATLRTQRRLVPTPGAYAISGTLAALRAQRQLVLTPPGAYAVVGTLADLRAQRRLTATAGAYALTGTAATLTYTPAGVTLTLTALPGTYAIAGTQASLRVGHRLIPIAGAYAIAGTLAGLSRGRLLQVAPGTYAIAGASVALRRAARVVTTAGVYTLVGTAVTFATVPLGQDFDEVLWSHFAMRQPWSGALVMRQPASASAAMRQPRAGALTMRQPSAGSVALLEED